MPEFRFEIGQRVFLAMFRAPEECVIGARSITDYGDGRTEITYGVRPVHDPDADELQWWPESSFAPAVTGPVS